MQRFISPEELSALSEYLTPQQQETFFSIVENTTSKESFFFELQNTPISRMRFMP